MALGKNLKKTKLIPEKEEKKSIPKKKVATSKKTTVSKKKAASKKATPARPTKAKKELIKKPKAATSKKATKPKALPKPTKATEEIKKVEKQPEPINSGLPVFIAKELHDRKKSLRLKYEQQIKELKGSQLQFVVIEIGGESYALDIDCVKEVVPIPTLSKTPNTPNHIKGIANVRGTTYPVFDLATKFRVIGDEIPKYLLVVGSEDVTASLTLSVLPTTLKTDGSKISGSMHMIEDASLDVSYIRGLIQQDEQLIYYLDVIELLKNDKAIVVPDHMEI